MILRYHAIGVFVLLLVLLALLPACEEQKPPPAQAPDRGGLAREYPFNKPTKEPKE